ncbi:MAG: amidohydrolase [Clostridia bacterium]|nr:amidohydrolase [Clostridia bacterium]
MSKWLKRAKDMQDKLVEMRRYLHKNAETGFQLKKTLHYIERQLKSMGYSPKKYGKAGLVVEVGTGEKRVLLRADMDGLPITEKTGLAYACKDGNMHACGHDMHTAMLLGAASLLKEREGELSGCVRLLFQPAEELLEGAEDCIKAGVLEGVTCALMLHVLTAVNADMGTAFISSEGESAPAADYFTIEVQGKGCHGSSPWEGVDALTLSARILLGLEELSAREIPPANPAILTVGSIMSGEGGNVISDKVILQGTIRAFDEEMRAFVKKRMETIASNTAKAFRGRAKVKYGGGCPTLVNDGKLSALAEKTLKRTLGEKRVFTSKEMEKNTKKGVAGSEDFAYISQAVPSLMIGLAAGEKGKGYDYPLHHPKARFDEGALSIGAALYAELAQTFLLEGLNK